MKDRVWLEKHLPHKGNMCLLDHVVIWNDEQIHCVATSHLNPNNPLFNKNRLCVSAAIEYAAQAMAAHGALLSDGSYSSRQGFIASVRNVEFLTENLNTLGANLDIYATRLFGDSDNVIYEFKVSDGGETKVTGRATVILDRDKVITL